MNWLFPELRRFPGPAQRRRAIGRALSAAQSSPWYLGGFGVLFAVSAFMIYGSRAWNLSARLRDVIADLSGATSERCPECGVTHTSRTSG